MANRLIGLEEAREFFLSQFSHHEIERLRAFLTPVNTQPIAPPAFPSLGQFQKMNNLIFGTPELYGVCFGATGMRYDLHPLINEIPVLKKIINAAMPAASPAVAKVHKIFDAPKKIPNVVRKLPPAPPPKKASLIPGPSGKRMLIPPAVIIASASNYPIAFSRVVGGVEVRHHAWVRFLERFYGIPKHVAELEGIDEERFIRFQKSFYFTKKIKLPEKDVIRRLLNNSFEKALYLENRDDRLWFVVSDTGSARRLITVEPSKTRDNFAQGGPRLPDWFERYRANLKQP